MKVFDRSDARTIIENHVDEEIQVWFIKRTDGSKRYMKAKVPMKFALNGTPEEKGIVTCIDLELSKALPEGEVEWRCINLDGVYRIESEDEVYTPQLDEVEESSSTLGEMDDEMDELFY